MDFGSEEAGRKKQGKSRWIKEAVRIQKRNGVKYAVSFCSMGNVEHAAAFYAASAASGCV